MRFLTFLRPKDDIPLKSVLIGGKPLFLDLRFRHEKDYFENTIAQRKDIDVLIMDKLLLPGDIVLDAGANIGYTTLHFLSRGAAGIFAFEPVPELYRRLAKLRDKTIRTYPYGLSDHFGKENIYISKTHNQGNSLNPNFLKIFPAVYGDKPEVCKVKLVPLDGLLRKIHFDFMKIDIEGSELAFLRGAAKQLATFPPRILQMEIYEGDFPIVQSEMENYFKYVRRAVVSKDLNSLLLLEPFDQKIKEPQYIINPPTYIYTNQLELMI